METLARDRPRTSNTRVPGFFFVIFKQEDNLVMKRCIYDYASGPLKYPLAALFLVDFYLTWKHNQAVLRGDPATNISCNLAFWSGIIGGMVHTVKHWNRRLARIFRRFWSPETANPKKIRSVPFKSTEPAELLY